MLRMFGKQECDRRTMSPGALKQLRGSASPLAKRSVIYADSMCKIEYAWPSRALSHDDIKLSAAAFRPGRLFRLSRHRDPAPARGACTVYLSASVLLSRVLVSHS